MFLLRLSLIVFAIFCAGLAAAYASGIWGLMSAGYPRAVWPALGAYETVRGSSKPLARHPALRSLNPRGQEIFATSGSRALLALKDGRLAVETYADRIGPETRLNSYSLVKSLVGALVLKAHAEGKIGSLEDPIGRYLVSFGPNSFRQIPIRKFLEMRSGIDFERNNSDKGGHLTHANPFGNLASLHADGVKAIAGRLEPKPELRGHFSYQNVNSAILGHLLTELYDRPLHALLSEKIWFPAGAADAFWLRHIETTDVTPYCCLYATARDWVKVAHFLMTNGGEEAPFLPEDLIRQFFGTHLQASDLATGVYGLYLRHNFLDRDGEDLQGRFSYMMGQGGQVVYMMPERDLIVVRFGEEHALLHSTLYSSWNSLHKE